MSAERNLGAFPAQRNPAPPKGCQGHPATGGAVPPKGTLCQLPPGEFARGMQTGWEQEPPFPPYTSWEAAGLCQRGEGWPGGRLQPTSGYPCLPGATAQRGWGSGPELCFLVELGPLCSQWLSLQLEAAL